MKEIEPLLPILMQLAIVTALIVPFMLTLFSFHLCFNLKGSKSTNKISKTINAISIVLSICELLTSLMVFPYVQRVLGSVLTVLNFGMILLTVVCEFLVINQLSKNKKEFLNNGRD